VLDPFLGSGTTAIAATLLGRKWIGIELSEKYVAIVEARIAKKAGVLACSP
jgi:DNA modification methylase